MKNYNNRNRSENGDEKVIDLQSRRQTRKVKKKKSKRKMIVLLMFLTLIAVLMSPYFNIRWFDVKGNNVVASSQIKSASNIALGQNMFRVNIKKSKDLIRKIPYIKDVNIYRHLKGGIIIKVTEREAFAYIKNATGDLVIDKEGRVLEIAGKDYDYTALLEITGLKCGNLKPGSNIGNNYAENLKIAVEVWDRLKENEIDDRVSSINIKSTKNISLLFDNDKEVVFGDTYRMEYKLAMLESALASLAPSEKGTIDLTVEGQALFTPKE